MFIESGVLHHFVPILNTKLVVVQINLSVPCPSPYKHKHGTKIGEINFTDKVNLFPNQNINEMTKIFADVFKNIISRSISNKIVTVDDKDSRWIAYGVKIIRRNPGVKRESNSNVRNYILEIQKLTTKLIPKIKTNYYTLPDKNKLLYTSR